MLAEESGGSTSCPPGGEFPGCLVLCGVSRGSCWPAGTGTGRARNLPRLNGSLRWSRVSQLCRSLRFVSPSSWKAVSCSWGRAHGQQRAGLVSTPLEVYSLAHATDGRLHTVSGSVARATLPLRLASRLARSARRLNLSSFRICRRGKSGFSSRKVFGASEAVVPWAEAGSCGADARRTC